MEQDRQPPHGHIHKIGSRGAGKQRLLRSWLKSCLGAGESIVIVDPAGDLAKMVKRLSDDFGKEGGNGKE